jgi:hypothetical protein
LSGGKEILENDEKIMKARVGSTIILCALVAFFN